MKTCTAVPSCSRDLCRKKHTNTSDQGDLTSDGGVITYKPNGVRVVLHKIVVSSRRVTTLPTGSNLPDDRRKNLQQMSYQEYLETPEWKSLRNKALERDGHRCRVCNSDRQLDVHHRTYQRCRNENVEDLTTLCRPCHELFTKNGKLATP